MDKVRSYKQEWSAGTWNASVVLRVVAWVWSYKLRPVCRTDGRTLEMCVTYNVWSRTVAAELCLDAAVERAAVNNCTVCKWSAAHRWAVERKHPTFPGETWSHWSSFLLLFGLSTVGIVDVHWYITQVNLKYRSDVVYYHNVCTSAAGQRMAFRFHLISPLIFACDLMQLALSVISWAHVMQSVYLRIFFG